MTEKEKLIRRLYDENRELLLRISRAFTTNEADAEDMVQETFLRAVYAADKLMDHQNPRAWLVETLKNCIRNDSRLCANRLNVSLEEFEDLAAREDDEPLENILPKGLSEGDRQLLIWRLEMKLSYREISRRLGITEAACRVKVCRIIKRCRNLMEK